MKKFLFLFVSIFIITSCSDEDDTLPVLEPSIIGSWELVKSGTINNNIETLNDYQNNCNNKKDYVQYLENGNAKRYTYDNNCSEFIGVFTYTKIGNILNTQTSTSEPSTEVEIVQLTNTTLKLRFGTNYDQINIFERK